MVSSSTAVEGVNIARSNTSQSVSSRPVLGRRPAWLKNRCRAITRNPSAVSSMQCNVIAIDKKFLPGSGDPPLGDSRTGEQQADLQSAAVYGHLPKKNIPALTGGHSLMPPPSGYAPAPEADAAERALG